MRSAIGELKASLADEPAFGPATQEESEGGDVVLISVPGAGDADAPEATGAIRHLRSDLISKAFGAIAPTAWER